MAACFDEVLAVAQRDAGVNGLTRELTVHYRKPIEIETDLIFTAWIESDDGRTRSWPRRLSRRPTACTPTPPRSSSAPADARRSAQDRHRSGGGALADERVGDEHVEVVGVEHARVALPLGTGDVAQGQRVGVGRDDVEVRAVGSRATALNRSSTNTIGGSSSTTTRLR